MDTKDLLNDSSIHHGRHIDIRVAGCPAIRCRLLSSGTKGKRFALPNSEILIHQPLIAGGGISGQCTDIKIHSDHMVKTREKLNRILAQNTGKPIEQINIDTERQLYDSSGGS